MSIVPIIVVYNVFCGDSPSVRALLEQGAKPLIIDNSTTNYHNDVFCALHGMKYYGSGVNLGLSKAYNIAISLLPDNVDYILWVDDDTILPDDCLEIMNSYVTQNANIDIFVPLVVTSNDKKRFLSPNILHNYNTYTIKSVGDLYDKHFSAINSGMLVKRTIYNEFRYDEKLFLDCLDHDFMVWGWEHGKTIKIMDKLVLIQDFSGEETNKKRLIHRFKGFAKDYRLYRKKHGASKFQTEFYLAKRFIHIIL